MAIISALTGHDMGQDTSDLLKAFASNVRSRREQLGMTRETLGEKSELSSDMIARIERAQNGLSFGRLEQLAKALGTSPVTLLGGTDPNYSGTKTEKQKLVEEINKELSSMDTNKLAAVKDIIGNVKKMG